MPPNKKLKVTLFQNLKLRAILNLNWQNTRSGDRKKELCKIKSYTKICIGIASQKYFIEFDLNIFY